MESISQEILQAMFKALNHLLIAGVVFIVWYLSKKSVIKNKRIGKTLIIGLLLCIVISFLVSLNLFSKTGGCGERELCLPYNDGPEPILPKQSTDFLYYMIILCPPLFIGVYSGKKNINENNSNKINLVKDN